MVILAKIENPLLSVVLINSVLANQILEAGLFFLVLGFGFFFTFITFKSGEFAQRTGMRLLAMALFLILAIFIGSGFEVSVTSNQTINNPVTNETWNETDQNVIIPGGTDSYWLAYLFYGFAILNLVVISREYSIERNK